VKVERIVGAFADVFESKIVIFETEVSGTVEPDFDEDGILGANLDGLLFGDLKELVVKAKGEIKSQNPLRTKGKDLRELVGWQEGSVSVGWVGGGNSATGIVIWDIGFLEEAVCSLNGRDVREAELFDKTVLMSFKTSFDATFGLGAMGGENLDAKLTHGARKLSERLLIP